jgi:hypothetical protein
MKGFVTITIQGEYSAISITDNEATIYRLYIGRDAGITHEEYLEKLEKVEKFVLEYEKTGRKVTITKVMDEG